MSNLSINMKIPLSPDFGTLTQVFPEKRQLPLEGLYLGQRLAELSVKKGKTLVLANFLTDKNGVIAKKDDHNQFRVPIEIKNNSDWRLFQELMAQADIVICGGAYIKRVSALGISPGDVLFQFEAGGDFEQLGHWRLGNGHKQRSPDLAIVSRTLDFHVPEILLRSGRRVVIFTTYATANSRQAKDFTASGVVVVGTGETGVDGNRMIEYLNNGMGYRVIMMAAGPSVLQILLDAKKIDLFYVSEAQLELPFYDPSTVQTILPGRKKVNELNEFHLAQKYFQTNVIAEDGSSISQFFLRYDFQAH